MGSAKSPLLLSSDQSLENAKLSFSDAPVVEKSARIEEGVDGRRPLLQQGKVGAEKSAFMYGSVVELGNAAASEEPLTLGRGLGPVGVIVAFMVAGVGTGVLSMPNAADQGSLAPTLAAVAFVGALCAGAAYYTAVACGLHCSVSYAEVVTVAVFGPDTHPLRRASGEPPAEMEAVIGAGKRRRDAPCVHPSDTHDDALIFPGGYDGAADPQRQRRHKRRQQRLAVESLIDIIANVDNVLGVIPIVRTVADLGPRIADHFGVGGVAARQWPYYACVFGILLPVCSMRTLKELFAMNLFGAATIFVVIATIAAQYFTTGGGDGLSSAVDRDKVRWFEIDASFMVMPPIVLTSFVFHNLIPQIACEMRNFTPVAFRRLSSASSLIMGVGYGCTAVFGYLSFGSAVSSAAADGSVINNYPADALWTGMRTVLLLHLVCAIPVWLVNTRVSLSEMYERLRAGRDDEAVSAAVFQQPLWLRLAQSFVLCVIVVGGAVAASSVATVLAWAGAVSGPLMLAFIPAAVAISVHGGAWAGSAHAATSGSPEVYEPWPAGRAIGFAWLAFGAGVQVLCLLFVAGVAQPRSNEREM